jgi:hypothetical protein
MESATHGRRENVDQRRVHVDARGMRPCDVCHVRVVETIGAAFPLITVRNTKKTRHLVDNESEPQPRNGNQEGDPKQEAHRVYPDSVSHPDGSDHWRQDECERHRQEPQNAKEREGEIFRETSSIYKFKDQERKH